MRWWLPCLLFVPAWAEAQSPVKPVLAIFDLEDLQKTTKNRSGLREVISTQLAGSGRFKVVPADQVKAALAAKKKQSYDSCYAESCQIEIGNELAASHTLVGSIQRFDSDCVLTLTLYSLREAASVGGAQAKGLCDASTLADLAMKAAQSLARGDKAPTAADPIAADPLPPPPATTDYEALAAQADKAAKEAEAKQAAFERARAEHLARLEQAWSNVVKFATTTAMERGRRIKTLEQFLKDFATDNPREGEAKELLAALKAGKEPAGGASGGMVRVPGGPFFMGCNPKVDTECEDDEKPGKTVSVAAFKIDEVEVTVAAYAACVKAGACSDNGVASQYWNNKDQGAGACNWGRSDRANHPMNCVNWSHADTYCRWAKKRLPTEAEWEKAARGTDGRKYPWGNEGYGTRKVANIADETAKRDNPGWTIAAGYDDGFSQTAPVGSFKAGASPYGALDMTGNVWEWVSDWYKSGEYRSVRGGSWGSEPGDARASTRGWNGPGFRYGDLGFRCAQSE